MVLNMNRRSMQMNCDKFSLNCDYDNNNKRQQWQWERRRWCWFDCLGLPQSSGSGRWRVVEWGLLIRREANNIKNGGSGTAQRLNTLSHPTSISVSPTRLLPHSPIIIIIRYWVTGGMEERRKSSELIFCWRIFNLKTG